MDSITVQLSYLKFIGLVLFKGLMTVSVWVYVCESVCFARDILFCPITFTWPSLAGTTGSGQQGLIGLPLC